MATETMNYGYPKPGEDDFYDINQYNQAMEMIDEDIKEMDQEKQNNLGIGAFKGNIDMLGENGLPQTSSVCWCQAKDLQGVLPYESQNDYCFTLETNVALDNQTASERSQRAIVYGEGGVRIFERLFVDGEWCNWRELLCTDGDTKNNVVTFQSGDMENPTEWVDIDPVQSNEKHSSLWQKISLGIKNLRYLKKMLGSTDISKLGDGTITGALSALNTGIQDVASHFITQPQTNDVITKINHWDFCIYKVGRIVTVLINFSGDMEPTQGTAYKLLTIPEVYRPIINVIATYPTQINGVTVMANINPDGSFVLFNDGVKITNDWICRQVFTYISKQ